VEVLAIKKFFCSFFDPFNSCRKSAFGAVAIPTRVVSIFIKVTAIALQLMSTKNAGSAILYRLDHLVMMERESSQKMTVIIKNIGYFERGFFIFISAPLKPNPQEGFQH